jgi:hypothetical protein
MTAASHLRATEARHSDVQQDQGERATLTNGDLGARGRHDLHADRFQKRREHSGPGM